jgi:hypothetical protein
MKFQIFGRGASCATTAKIFHHLINFCLTLLLALFSILLPKASFVFSLSVHVAPRHRI